MGVHDFNASLNHQIKYQRQQSFSLDKMEMLGILRAGFKRLFHFPPSSKHTLGLQRPLSVCIKGRKGNHKLGKYES